MLEFIPKEIFLNPIKQLFGLEIEPEDQEESCVNDQSGIERVGSTSLIDNMGAMFLIAVVILFVFIILALLIVIGKRCKCAQKVAVVIKKKLLYNTLLRYVL